MKGTQKLPAAYQYSGLQNECFLKSSVPLFLFINFDMQLTSLFVTLQSYT